MNFNKTKRACLDNGFYNGENDINEHSASHSPVNGVLKNGHSSNGTISKKTDREFLPIDEHRNEIIQEMKANIPTMIFVGETASGKSTQIPQCCLEAGLGMHGKIGVTQPRRVAAQTLAERVAFETNTKVGCLVGYKFRFEDTTTAGTQIDFLTDGMVLREALKDQLLSKYSTVIVDEAHERSINTDVLMFVLKLAQKQRFENEEKPLKIILMSATIDTDKFKTYFNDAPVYYVKGRIYNVRLFHAFELNINDDDYLTNSLTVVCNLHEDEPINQGLLVFLTGKEEIEIACRHMRLYMNAKFGETKFHNADIIPLYSGISSNVQSKAFGPPTADRRKIIFATNIAETSVTIPGIKIVIDSGKVKQKEFLPDQRVDVLKVVNISKQQAIQRAGRAGRLAEGKCYRLYSSQNYEALLDEQLPEIKRSNISSVLLLLISLGMKRRSLRVMDSPDPEYVDSAIEELIELGAIRRSKEEHLTITELGQLIVDFPLDPSHAVILLEANHLDCLDLALTAVAFMASETIFQYSNIDLLTTPVEVNGGQDFDFPKYVNMNSDVNRRFHSNEGDYLRLIKLYQAYTSLAQKHKSKNDSEHHLKDWCKQLSVNKNRLENVIKVRKQLEDLCRENNMTLKKSVDSDYNNLRRAICRGLLSNACVLRVLPNQKPSSANYQLLRRHDFNVKIHPSSCVAHQTLGAFVFNELVRSTETFARGICLVDEEWLHEMRQKQKLLHEAMVNGNADSTTMENDCCKPPKRRKREK